MTTELEIIRTFWPIIYAVAAAALAFVVWLIRLEGKQKSNHEKIVHDIVTGKQIGRAHV